MGNTLTRAEKDAVKNALKEKRLYKSNTANQYVALIVGSLLIISPLILLLIHPDTLSHLSKSIALYLALMVLMGILLLFYFAFIIRENKLKKENGILRSSIIKIVNDANIEIE